MIANPTLKMAMAAAEMLYSAKAKQTPKKCKRMQILSVLPSGEFAVGHPEKYVSSSLLWRGGFGKLSISLK